MQLHVLPWVATSTHPTPSLFHSLSSHNLHVTLSPHRQSLQSCFHHQWIYLSLQPCSTSMFSTTLLLHSLHLVCCLQLLFMMLLTVMFLLSYLKVLVYEQLDVFMGRKVHRHLINYITKCALNGVFVFALLETIVPVLIRGKWTHAISRDMATLMARNLSIENQNEHEN